MSRGMEVSDGTCIDFERGLRVTSLKMNNQGSISL